MATRYECDRCHAQSENDFFVKQSTLRLHGSFIIRVDLCKECQDAMLAFVHPVTPEDVTASEGARGAE